MRALTDDDFNCEKEMNALALKLANSNFPLGMVRTAIMSAFDNDPKDLRKQSLNNKSSDEVDSISFVHFYDPSLPKIFSEVKALISRIFTSGDLRPIFGGIRIVDSLREPSNLTRTLQHSRFDGSSGADYLTGVRKCGHRGCMTCREMNFIFATLILHSKSNQKWTAQLGMLFMLYFARVATRVTLVKL